MSATCSTHPDVAASTACARCGRFICEPCGRWASQQRWCHDCFKRFDPKPSREAKTALLLSTFGMLFVIPGIVSLVFAFRELERISADPSREASRETAVLARNIGLVSVLVGVMLLIALFRD